MNDATRFSRFLQWCLAPENSATYENWSNRWTSLAAAAYRSKLGKFRDKRGLVCGEVVLRSDGPPFESYLSELRSWDMARLYLTSLESEYRFQLAKPFAELLALDRERPAWRLPILHSLPDFTPEQQRHLSSLRKQCEVHASNASRIAAENQTAAFHQKVASLLKRESKVREMSKGGKVLQRLKILGCFFTFCEKRGRLPHKHQLEQIVYGSISDVSANDSRRNAYNRALRDLGLDGLPERSRRDSKAAGRTKRVSRSRNTAL